MTVSFTRCLKNAWLEVAARLRCGLKALMALLAGTMMVMASALADVAPPEITQLRVERTEDGVYLTAAVRFDLPPVVEDALVKGIPMFFVAEVELNLNRWYWTDKKIVSEARHFRLAYQPLTRRWRLNVSPTPITNAGLGVTLNQTYESLPDAMAAIKRIARWKIAEASEMDPEAQHNVNFRFRLDVSQLPRPFQIGAVGQSDWNVSVSRNQRLIWENGK